MDTGYGAEQQVVTVQRDHINRWTGYRLSLPADVVHIPGADEGTDWVLSNKKAI